MQSCLSRDFTPVDNRLLKSSINRLKSIIFHFDGLELGTSEIRCEIDWVLILTVGSTLIKVINFKWSSFPNLDQLLEPVHKAEPPTWTKFFESSPNHPSSLH